MNKIEQLKAAKEKANAELLQAIIDDTTMPKLEKLQTIDDSDVLPYHGWIVRPLEEKYKDLFKAQIEEKHGVQPYLITDSWPFIDCDYYDRGSKVSFADLLESEYENAAYAAGDVEMTDEQLEKTEVTVMTNRSRDITDEYKISLGQLADDLYEWCIANGEIGCYFDW